MADNQFAPPSKEELAMFSPPSKEELGSFGPPSHEELSSVGAAKSPGLMSRAVDFLSHSNSPFFKGANYLMNGGAQQVAKALDYPGGLVRTAAAGGAGVLTGHPDAVTSKDLSESFKGNAPSSAEYMGRLGIPEGPSVHVPYVDKTVSARDVGGFLSDAATNPLSYMGGFGAGEAMEGAGKGMYKSAFSKIDERLAEKNKMPLSEILLENGAPTGGAEKIGNKAEQIQKTVGAQRQGLLDEAKDLGAHVDMGYPMPRAEAVIARMQRNPVLADEAQELTDQVLNKYKNAGKTDLGQVSEWKTDLSNSLPKSAYGPDGKLRSWPQKLSQALASDMRNDVVNSGNAYKPGLGEAINNKNERWGALEEAFKPIDLASRQEAGKKWVTPFDMALALIHPHAEVGKKVIELGNSMPFTTSIGKGLMNVGQSGVVDPALRQALINMVSNKKKNTPTENDQDTLRVAH